MISPEAPRTLLRLLSDACENVWSSSIWLHAGPPQSREIGWKLHLAATPENCAEVLSAVLPILSRRVSFKIAQGPGVLARLNEGAYGATQVGKFMTIYPVDDAHAVSLASELFPLTLEFDGPRIVSDQHISGIIYTRFGSFAARRTRNRLGQFALVGKCESSQGELSDKYCVPFCAPPGIANPFPPAQRQGDDEQPNILGSRYLVIDVLHSHPRGSVFLAIDTHIIQPVVLKEARKLCQSDGLGRDRAWRLRKEVAVLKAIESVVCAPLSYELFEDYGNTYAVSEYISDRTLLHGVVGPWFALNEADRREVRRRVLALVDAVASLHRAGFSHRDLKPSNILMTYSGEVCIIDFDMAHAHADETAVLAGGTAGYIAPDAHEFPRIEADVYALGATIVSLLLANIDVGVVPRSRLGDRIAHLTGVTTDAAEALAACMSPHASARPTLDDLRERLRRSLTPQERPRGTCNEISMDRILSGLLDLTIVDSERVLWLSESAGNSTNEELELRRSANRGVSGPLYLLARLHKHGVTDPRVIHQANHVVDWLLRHEWTPDDQMQGLHFGEAGVAVAISEAVSAGLVAPGDWLEAYVNNALSGPLDWPDVTHGAAGQGIAALVCSQLLDSEALICHAERCAAFLAQTQQKNGAWLLPDGVQGMSGKRLTGFAHGVAGIVYFLAALCGVRKNEVAEGAARTGAAWLIGQRRTLAGGAWNWPLDESSSVMALRWCHGSPGIALAFMKLYTAFGDDVYRDAAECALRSIPRRYRSGNLSTCCGMAGLGEILLEGWRTLGDPSLREQSDDIASFLEAVSVEGDRGAVAWRVGDGLVATADLFSGSGGPAHFLMRRLAPRYGYPLLVG